MSSDAVRTDSPGTGRQTATEVEILDELHELFQHVKTPPPQFQNLLTACQYLPIYRLTKKHAKPGMEVLDWGSGNGHFSYLLLRHGMTVTGFNLGAESCALAPRLAQLFPDRYHIQYGAADDRYGCRSATGSSTWCSRSGSRSTSGRPVDRSSKAWRKSAEC